MKDEGDYYRMLKETFFEAYYDQIEEFTFKSVIVPMTLEETEALTQFVGEPRALTQNPNPFYVSFEIKPYHEMH